MIDLKNLFQQATELQFEINHLPGVLKRPIEDVSVIPKLRQVVTDPELYKSVSRLFQNGHHAQAVETAYKFLNNLVKDKTGVLADGNGLMTTAFSPKQPLLKLNAMENESEKDEQLGYMQIYAGVMSGIRNPRAHEHDWEDTEERAVQLLSLANHLVLRVRQATKTNP